ncbi:MAG: CarD family transcriptional regulator, partial [candidate division WOR-3 bacterium]
MEQLIAAFQGMAAFSQLVERLHAEPELSVTGLVGSGRALLAVALARELRSSLLFVCQNEADASSVHQDLCSLLQGAGVLFLRSGAESQVQLVNTLRAGKQAVIVSDAATLNEQAIVLEAGQELELELRRGGLSQPGEVMRWLVDSGYETVELVTEVGECSVRGGIIDVFPVRAEAPVRVEFFGDKVESIRSFDPLTQRSVRRCEEARIEARVARRSDELEIAALLPRDLVILDEKGAELPGRFRVHLVAQSAGPGQASSRSLDLGMTSAPNYLGNLALLRSELEAAPIRYFVACADEFQRDRLGRLLGEQALFFTGRLHMGFAVPDAGFGLLTEREIYGRPVMREARHKFRGLPVDDLLALRRGDYVVHVHYGIGVFEGTKRLLIDGHEHDFLHVRYADNACVYVPIESLALLDRYVGPDDSPPKLDRLGSKSWRLARTRTASAVRDYAEELLAIYAQREASAGFAFSQDSALQREIEATFVHEETPNQLRA